MGDSLLDQGGAVWFVRVQAISWPVCSLAWTMMRRWVASMVVVTRTAGAGYRVVVMVNGAVKQAGAAPLTVASRP